MFSDNSLENSSNRTYYNYSYSYENWSVPNRYKYLKKMTLLNRAFLN